MCSWKTITRTLTGKQRRLALALMANPLARHEDLAQALQVKRPAVTRLLQRLNARLRAKGLLPIGTRLAA